MHIHDHGENDALPFDTNDPELQQLANEMRTRRYLRDHKQFVEIFPEENSYEH